MLRERAAQPQLQDPAQVSWALGVVGTVEQGEPRSVSTPAPNGNSSSFRL